MTAGALLAIAAVVMVSVCAAETYAHECERYDRHQHAGGIEDHAHEAPAVWVDKSADYGGTWHDHCIVPARPALDAGDGRTPSAVWWWR